MQMPADGLHAALVMSARAHAALISVDASPAEKCEGFVAFYSAKDIPRNGHNEIGAIVKDEEVFATKEVSCDNRFLIRCLRSHVLCS